jgi:hypothetical protein
VATALRISERFDALAASVDRIERTPLNRLQQLDFAAEALALRFPKDLPEALEPARFLVPRRAKDVGIDLWHTFTCFRRTFSGVGSCDSRLATGCAAPVVSPPVRRACG